MENHLKAKKIAGTILNIILWIYVAFSVAVTAIAVSANENAKNVPTIAGKCFLFVQSDSMNAARPADVPDTKPSGFSKGTMIIGQYIADDDAAIERLEVGDIITYEWDITGDGVVSPGENNTHRITNITKNDSGVIISFDTMGDNLDFSHGKSETVRRDAVISVYTGTKVPAVGTALAFLNTQLGFGLCILLPLVAFFIFELVKFIRTLISVKNSGKKVISAADEELIKQKAVEEYLRRQQENADSAATDAPDSSDSADKGDGN